MENKKFSKNDCGFICETCGNIVKPLGYTSRDHCPICLTSIHVDINPGDRANECKGVMEPINVTSNTNEYIVEYRCTRCGKLHNNKSANDDDFDTLLSVMNKTYNLENFKMMKSLHELDDKEL